MKLSTKKKIKKIFTKKHIIITISTLIILISLVVLLSTSEIHLNVKETQEASESKQEEITQEEASKIAINQFKKLGEDNLKTDDLQIMQIKRNGEQYYYIASPENSVEIQISTGEITRINAVKIAEQ